MATTAERVRLVSEANEAGRASSRGGAPTLTIDAAPSDVARWLQWNDPNGCHTDELARAEGFDAYNDETAWEALAEMLAS